MRAKSLAVKQLSHVHLYMPVNNPMERLPDVIKFGPVARSFPDWQSALIPAPASHGRTPQSRPRPVRSRTVRPNKLHSECAVEAGSLTRQRSVALGFCKCL